MDKHNNWDYWECSCRCGKDPDYPNDKSVPDDDVYDLHMNYIQLMGEVKEMLSCLEAKDLLDKGVRGMGHNILVEKAARFRGYIRTLQRLTDGGLE